MSWKTDIARRPLLASLAGFFGVAVAGGLAYKGVHVFGRRYPRTKFDDLLDQLGDRESAAKLGQAVVAQAQGHSMEPARFPLGNAADEIRTGPGRGSLARAVAADIDHGRLVAIQGWVLPISLVKVAVIAAAVQQPSWRP